MNSTKSDTQNTPVLNESVESSLELEVRRSRKVRTGIKAGLKPQPGDGLTTFGG